MKKIIAILIINVFLISTNLFAQVIADGISSTGILDSKIPDVQVIYPNGGEVFQVSDLVDIQWTAVDSSFGSNPVTIYFSSDSGASFSVIYPSITNESPMSWQTPAPTLEGLIRIVVVDSFGLAGSDTSDLVFKIDGPPAQPEGLIASPADHVINLSWNSVDEGDMDKYHIYRSTDSNVAIDSDNLIDSVYVPNITYADSNVVHGETYYYVVTAIDSMGNESVASSEVSETAYILSITSVSFQQRKDGSKYVDIYYSFAGNPAGTYTITPYYSIDDGDSWTECSMILSGDSGPNIEPGAYSIVWDFGSELEDIYKSRALIKISGVEDQIPEKSMSVNPSGNKAF